MEIKYSKQALKFLNKLDKISKSRIIKAIEELPLGDVKKLKGYSYYRLRVGDFRVIFDRDFNILSVIKIDNRGEVYKKWEGSFMKNVKERIIGAVTVMNEEEANRLWDIILREHQQTWENIEEVEPDEFDLKMIDDIKNDPECKIF